MQQERKFEKQFLDMSRKEQWKTFVAVLSKLGLGFASLKYKKSARVHKHPGGLSQV